MRAGCGQPSSACQRGLQLPLGAECPGRGCPCTAAHASPLQHGYSWRLSPPCAALGPFALLGSGFSARAAPPLFPVTAVPWAVPALPGEWGRDSVLPCSICTGCPSPLPQFTALEFQSNAHAKRTAINLAVSIRYCLF